MKGTASTLAAPDRGAARVALDEVLNWHAIDWQTEEDNVRRLRQRIFTASKEGRLTKVRRLQRLMLRSRSNVLVSVRRVTQYSKGRNTAGLDGHVVITPTGRAELALSVLKDVRTSKSAKARPVKRVYIPKSNGKKRPLGIPVIRDRVLQAIVKNALEPEWEARFEAKSYGFRPGRGPHDAISSIFLATGQGRNRTWVLDADLSAAFDKIDHQHLLDSLGSFPARGMVREWLKAGVVEDGLKRRTEMGTPQGGVISPLLLNVALHGLEAAAGVRYRPATKTGPRAGKVETSRRSPVLVRYADDFVVLCFTKAQAKAAKRRIAKWLRPRGLTLNEEKTSIVQLSDGFDFLGFNVRRYSNGSVYIKPSKAAISRMKQRLTTEVRGLLGSNSSAVVKRLNPILRGWAAYYRVGVSKKVFGAIDKHLHERLAWWVRRSHQKGRRAAYERHFRPFIPGRITKTFGVKSTGAYVVKIVLTGIKRHVPVRGSASLDDPTLTKYWDTRRRKRKETLPVSPSRGKLVRNGLCSLCGLALVSEDGGPLLPEDWEKWLDPAHSALHVHHVVPRSRGGKDEYRNLILVHAECHLQHHATHPLDELCR